MLLETVKIAHCSEKDGTSSLWIQGSSFLTGFLKRCCRRGAEEDNSTMRGTGCFFFVLCGGVFFGLQKVLKVTELLHRRTEYKLL